MTTTSAELAGVKPALDELHRTIGSSEGESFIAAANTFVSLWQKRRALMETHAEFVHQGLVVALVGVLADDPAGEVTLYALRIACLMARADANALSLLEAGAVAAVLRILHADPLLPDEDYIKTGDQVEAALALLQNVAFSSEGVASILREGGVGTVLRAMSAHLEAAPIQKNGLGVLWNLCDDDDHWVSFLREGSFMVSVLLSTLSHHARQGDDAEIEGKVMDMLWDFSSMGDGQAYNTAATSRQRTLTNHPTRWHFLELTARRMMAAGRVSVGTSWRAAACPPCSG